ncbi:MAG: ssl1498 family light-harvesting-like protein (plasmid) [Leptolyngbya sp. BL-A-14]
MTAATATSLDFRSMAQTLVTNNQTKVSTDRELVPAEASVRGRREGQQFLRQPNTLGATVDQEGLNNNYAVEPPMYYANFPAPEQVRSYLKQAAVAAFLTVTVLLTAFAVS